MPYFEKHFTVEEANALIPRIQEIFREVRELLEAFKQQGSSPAVSASEVTPGRTNGKSNGHPTQPAEGGREAIRAKINDLLSEIAERGIVIQDFQRGLIDFPSYVNGEEVFLCYEPDDGDRVQYWHHLNAGYAGRTKLGE